MARQQLENGTSYGTIRQQINSNFEELYNSSTAAGAEWFTGEGEPSGLQGKDGDYYINTLTGDVYNKASGSWTIKLNIKGPQGEQGEPGTKGDPGEPGAKGDPGERGEGVPAGGTTGQVLTKKSETDYDTEWKTPSGGTSGNKSFNINSISELYNLEANVGDLAIIFKPNMATQTRIDDPAKVTDDRYIDGMESIQFDEKTKKYYGTLTAQVGENYDNIDRIIESTDGITFTQRTEVVKDSRQGNSFFVYDGKATVAEDTTGKLQIWDLSTFTKIETTGLDTQYASYYGVIDGKYVVIGGLNDIFKSDDSIAYTKLNRQINSEYISYAFAYDKVYAIVNGSKSGKIYTIDLNTDKAELMYEFFGGSIGLPDGIDDQYIYFRSNGNSYALNKQDLTIYNIEGLYSYATKNKDGVYTSKNNILYKVSGTKLIPIMQLSDSLSSSIGLNIANDKIYTWDGRKAYRANLSDVYGENAYMVYVFVCVNDPKYPNGWAKIN